VAFWQARHLPGLRLTANGTQNDKAEVGSIPALTTKIKIMIKVFYSNQIGFMICWGKNFQSRPYITFDIPFFIIQIFFK